MDAVKCVKEFNRMCRSYDCCSDGCPLKRGCCILRNPNADSESIEALVAIVEKWSEEHPVVTNGLKVHEMIPGNERRTVFKEADSSLKGCGLITSKDYVEMRIRRSWWDAEYKEEE